MAEQGWFSIRLTGWEEFPSKKEANEYIDRLTERAGKSIADSIHRKMSGWLAPGHKYNIGASGAASANFNLVLNKPAVGRITWEIVEGNATKANQLIREGIPEGYKADVRFLKAWVGRKIGHVEHPDTYGMTEDDLVSTGMERKAGRIEYRSGYQYRHRKGSLVKVKEYGRRAAGLEDAVIAAVHAMKNALKSSGSFRPPGDGRKGANWYTNSPYPKKRGRFDYFAYMAKQRNVLNSLTMAAGSSVASSIVDYIRTGRKKFSDVTLEFGFIE